MTATTSLGLTHDPVPVMRIKHKRGTRIRYSRTEAGDPVIVEIVFPAGAGEGSRLEGLPERIYALVDEHFGAAREAVILEETEGMSFGQLCASLGRSAALRLAARAA